MITRCLSSKYMCKSGKQKGFVSEKGGALLLAAGTEEGIFVSRIYDSGVPDMEWGKLTLDLDENVPFYVSVLLFSKSQTAKRLEEMESVQEQYAFITAHGTVTSSYRDVLLYGEKLKKGRYICFGIKVLRNVERARISFRGYEITFPKDNFTRYLPSLYQDNPQLERYMAVLQEPYLALERQIETIPEKLDAEQDRGQLLLLAGWLGYEERVRALDSKLLLKLLRGGTALARQKGTAPYYTSLVKILTGQEAVLIENPKKRECILLIRGEPETDKLPYLDWITANAPLGVTMKAVVLRPDERLDETCFLDYTAQLSEKECMLTEEGISIDGIMLV